MTDKIVICGANGYVGRNMVDHLARAGHKHIVAVSRSAPAVETWNCVERVTADLTNLASCVNAVSGAAYVYNFAANVGGIGFIKQNHADCMLGSVINTNLLRACTQVAPELRGYFFSSSSCVYPCIPNWAEEFSEDMAHPASPTKGYGWDKLFSEEVCDAFCTDYRVPVRIARYHTIYGPGDDRPAGREHVTEALCKKVVAAKLSGKHEITIWGDGEQTRSFLYIDDCIRGTERIMHSGYSGPLNLGNSERVSVNDLVTHLEDIAGVKLARFYQKGGPVGAQDKRTENSHACHVLNWEPRTPIKDGLRILFNDYWSNAICKTVYNSKTP